jgi:hypothetical protein
MGHHYLDGMVRTHPYKRVVALLGESAGGAGAINIEPGTLEEIAEATLVASDDGLERAKADEGLTYCLYLLTEITRAARQKNFGSALARAGLPSPGQVVDSAGSQGAPRAEYTVFDLVSGFSIAVDRHLRRTRARTDIGEMAQMAAAESLTALCSARATTLFGSTEQSVQDSLRPLSTQKGFGTLAHDFFSRLARRYLEYHLSRELSNHVGGNRRFESVNEHNEFLARLDTYCRTSAGIVREFAGDWYSVHKFKDDITLEKTRGFAAHAVDKLRAALSYQGGGSDV